MPIVSIKCRIMWVTGTTTSSCADRCSFNYYARWLKSIVIVRARFNNTWSDCNFLLGDIIIVWYSCYLECPRIVPIVNIPPLPTRVYGNQTRVRVINVQNNMAIILISGVRAYNWFIKCCGNSICTAFLKWVNTNRL